MSSERPKNARPTRGSSFTGRCFVVDDPRFATHAPRGHHPERPERLLAARAGLTQALSELQISADRVAPRAATEEELLRVHEPRLLEQLAALGGHEAFIDPDTYVSARSVTVAWEAAGSAAALVENMLGVEGRPSRGIALLRPPGHHARPTQAMGFCLLNNVAVAAATARKRGLERIAIVDWDVHHGNGTQEAFWGDPNVLYLSLHQYPFYPGTGAATELGGGSGTGYTVNVPLSAGATDAVYVAAFERVILPVLESFSPELILVSAGFDAAHRDPLAQMHLSADAFGWMAGALTEQAERSGQGRIALVLEGGYDLTSLEAGVRSAVRGLFGVSPSLTPGSARPGDLQRAESDLRRVEKVIRPHWPT